ncbi:MAG: glycosyltransferase [Planctomycetota bacterium]
MASRAETTVLHVRIVSGTGGGPEKTIANSPRHMRGSGFRAFAAYLHAPGDPGIAEVARRADAAGCELIAIPDAFAIDPRTLQKLARLCRERDVRIWHGHDYKSNLFGWLLARRCDLKLFSTVHGWVKHTQKTPLYFAVDRFALRRYDEVVAVSQDLFDECARFGVQRERLTLIENAIDTEQFRRVRAASESPLRASLPARRLLVGAMGRLSEEKGFHFLIEAFERAVDAGCELALWIAGEGDQKERLAAQITASRHRDRMQLVGFVADPVAFQEALDLYVLSSLREGLPNVVLEAMAMEVPVLATRSGGMDAFARDENDALLVAPGSVDELERGLVRLARDAELRARLARSARARVERDQSFARRMQKEIALYERLMRAGGG